MKTVMGLLLAATLTVSATTTQPYEKVQDRCELEILSPTLAQRQTAKIRLKNGLEAYLISDPGVEQSAAALAVETGSWDDPVEYPGMAHFLEHMLFMGTAAYPDEHEYMQYIGDYGGKVNAYTASDRTVYMFSVNNEGFEGALDRFSHFFIDPLFQPSCINRELHAVDQEHAKNIEHDGWRQYMIFKEIGNQHHPFSKFSTGNAETLGGIPQSAMKQWYHNHYSAEKMHLVILSSLPLDTLIEATVQDFSSAPNNALASSTTLPTLFSDTQKGQMVYIKPVRDIKVLSLTWELPKELSSDQEAQVGTLISYILDNGNKNSLLGQLKREHLAEKINASEDRMCKSAKLFTVEIELTDKGIDQVPTVISYFFETLARLKKTGVPRYIFNEVQKIAQLQYQYQSREEAFEFVMKTAHGLVDEELATYPKKTFIPQHYNPEIAQHYLAVLTPEACIYCLMADPSKTGIVPTKSEKWMGAEYALAPISQKQLQAWQRAEINPQIGLPPPNPFVPQNLALLHSTPAKEMPTPSVIHEDAHGKIYFSEDQNYLTPKVVHLFRLKSPLLDGTAKAKALTDLFTRAVNDQLFPILSSANTAGSAALIRSDNLSITVGIDAYSEPAPRLIEDLFINLKKIHCTKEQFELYKQSLSASYENRAKELPFIQSAELLSSIIFNDTPSSRDKLSVLHTISYAQFNAFCQDLFKKTYVEGLLYGNLNRQEADQIWQTVNKKLHAEGYPLQDQHQRQVFVLPNGQGPYMISQTTPMMGNAVLLMIEQGPYSFEKRAAQQLVGTMLRESFFDTLRTKQQTAYIAKAWDKEEEKQLMQFFAVQSGTHKPSELIARFELFLEDFVKYFTTECPPTRFENLRKMAIATLSMPPENLMLMGSRLFQLAFDYDADFQLVPKRIEALQKLSYDDVYAMAQETLSRKNGKRIAILLEGITPKEKEFHYELTTKEQLLNQGTFVAWR